MFLLILVTLLHTAAYASTNTTCTPCLATKGSFLTPTGFDLCPAGTIGTVPPSRTCLLCPPGRSSYQGAVSCAACPIGKYAPEVATPSCLSCDRSRRFFQDKENATGCLLCEHGEQSTGDGCVVRTEPSLPIATEIIFLSATSESSGLVAWKLNDDDYVGNANYTARLQLQLSSSPFFQEFLTTTTTILDVRVRSFVVDNSLLRRVGTGQERPLHAVVTYARIRFVCGELGVGVYSAPSIPWTVASDCDAYSYLDT